MVLDLCATGGRLLLLVARWALYRPSAKGPALSTSGPISQACRLLHGGFTAVREPIGRGRCPVCHHWTLIVQIGRSAREDRRCLRCRASARARALVDVLEREAPDWRAGAVFEPSPSGRASQLLRDAARVYESSVFRPDAALGAVKQGHRNEDIERLTFRDECFDVVVSQDVLEHVFAPEAACREIARVLRPGGVHVFTVPVNEQAATRRRAERHADGSVVHLVEPEFHGDPYSADGALVITDWGHDIVELVDEWSGLRTSSCTTTVPPTSKDPPITVFISCKPEIGTRTTQYQ